MSQLTPTVSSERPRSRIVASPSRKITTHSYVESPFVASPFVGEDVVVEIFPQRHKSVTSRAASRASYKSINVISSASDQSNREGESSGEYIESSELYDAKANTSSDSSRQSFMARSAQSQTPIADRFSANITGMSYQDVSYSPTRDTSGLLFGVFFSFSTNFC